MPVQLSVLPAAYGDCLWLEHRARGRVHRIVVDGGTTSTGPRLAARIAALPPSERHVDLFVVSHVDADHIGGALGLLRQPPAGLTFGEVWFNARRHLPRPRGPQQGEHLTTLLDELPKHYPWNTSFRGRAVATEDEGTCRTVELPFGARVTLLSPTPAKLAALATMWDKTVERAARGEPDEQEPQPVPRSRARTVDELAALPTRHDRTAPNGSSIAMIVELAGRSLLLAADAHPNVLVPALEALARSRGKRRVSVDAVKLPHHGSQANVTEDLVRSLRSRTWIVSTNGERFGHPDPAAIARVLLHGGPRKTICFNYRSRQTRRWDDPALMRRYDYAVAYPARRGAGITIDL